MPLQPQVTKSTELWLKCCVHWQIHNREKTRHLLWGGGVSEYPTNTILSSDVTGSQAPHMATVNHNYCFSVPTAAQRNTEAFKAAIVRRKHTVDGGEMMQRMAVKTCRCWLRILTLLLSTPGVTKYLITIGAPIWAELTPCIHYRFAISAHMSAFDTLCREMKWQSKTQQSCGFSSL